MTSRRIVRDVIVQSVGRYVGAVLGIARGLLIPRFLDPSLYGVFKTYQTVSELSRVLTLGIPSSLFRELPMAQAREQEERRLGLLDNAFWSQLVSAAPVAVAFLVGGATGWIHFEGVTLTPWYLLLVPLLFVDRTKIFFDVVFNGQKQFVLQAQIRLLDEVLTSLLCILGAWRFGFNGLLVAFVVVNATIMATSWVASGYRVGGRVDRRLAKEMIGVGFPHMLNGLCNTLYNQLDRLVILGGGLGMSAVGFYSVGMTIADQLVAAALILARVIMPRMMEQYGARENVEDIRHLVVGPARLSGLLYAPAVVLVALAGDAAFHTLLIKYEPGLVPMKIMMIGTFFLAIWASVHPFFLAVKRQWALLACFAATIPLAIVLLYFAIRSNLGLPGVAAASAVTDCVFATSVLWLALKSFSSSWQGRVREVVLIYAPLAAAGAALLAARVGAGAIGLTERPVASAVLTGTLFSFVYGVPAGLLLVTERGRRHFGLTGLGD